MERGARWTLAVVGAAVGFGFGLAHLVWHASSGDGTGVEGCEAAMDWREPGPRAGAGLPTPPRAGGGYPPDYPPYAAGPFRAYGSRAEPGWGWRAAPPAGYPAWGGVPEGAYAPRWVEPSEWGGGYPPVHPSAEHPSWAGGDPAAWWAPEPQDGPPPPSPDDPHPGGSPSGAEMVPAPEVAGDAGSLTPDRPPPEPEATAPE